VSGETASPSRLLILLKQVIPYIGAVVASFAAAGVFLLLLRYDVLGAYYTILFTSFLTANGFVQTLLKFVPLLLSALAFTIPLNAGKFNIGSEGQMLLGAIGAAFVGIFLAGLGVPFVALLPLALIMGTLLGAFWGAIPAWLLYRFDVNEILSTVLLNSVSFALVDYVATEVWPDRLVGHPTTVLFNTYTDLPLLTRMPPLHSGLIIAVVVAFGVYVMTTRTSLGYEMRATGSNMRAANVFGIDVKVLALLSLILGGAMGGLAGAIEATGIHHRLIEGLQSNYLVLGIIIGLIGKGNSRIVPFVAFLIAILEVGASAMQRTLAIPAEIVLIVEGLILVFVLLADLVQRR